jgi:bacteriocin-like protein
MSEEQLKAADTDAALEQDYAELSDEELAGVSGGGAVEARDWKPIKPPRPNYIYQGN